MTYIADISRYGNMEYRKCGCSGLKLPVMSLGLWHNFGTDAPYSNCREMILGSFDLGITHFDLANNYGPVPGSAEETFGRILSDDLKPYRDEIIISTKAGYDMWPGPYGDHGSRKYLIASLDQSLKRMKLDYVDIFYHHRPDPDTPLEETMGTLRDIVKSGKALYVGISNYGPEDTRKAIRMLKDMGIHCLVHQMRYSLLDCSNDRVLSVLREEGVGAVAFSPLKQGILTGKYLSGIPADSRANGHSQYLKESSLTPEIMETTMKLKEIADRRGDTLSHMALAWVLAQEQMTGVIMGARNLEQIKDNLKALNCSPFSDEENKAIDALIGR